MTLAELIQAYKTDDDSSYRELRYQTRVNQDGVLARIVRAYGNVQLADIKARQVRAWHKEWTHDGKKVAVGHDMVKRLRTVFRFGMTFLEDAECTRLATVMGGLRFSTSGARTERLSADQAIAVRTKAHEIGWHSMALGQAFQFEVMLRQKDVIGEYVPLTEPGDTLYTFGSQKWLRGATWEEIDEDLTLRHITSKKGKPLEVSLRLYPMVMEELAFISCETPETVTRDRLPKTGPLLRNEFDRMPWSNNEYRRKWRKVANAVGIPASVKNMDSRAGGITEATEAGADIEHVKHAATHSNISMTQRYSRATNDKIESVQRKRVEHRNKQATNDNGDVAEKAS